MKLLYGFFSFLLNAILSFNVKVKKKEDEKQINWGLNNLISENAI